MSDQNLKSFAQRNWKVIVIVMFGIAALLYIFSTTFKTPRIEGVVLDAETGKPDAGARIYAKWERRTGGPGDQFSAGVDKRLRLRTKDDGTFLIRAHTLFNFIPSPIGQGGTFLWLYMQMNISIQYLIFSIQETLKARQDQDISNSRGN